MPLHAAGHHDNSGRPNPQTVLYRAVSSYIPTVRALQHARSHPTGTPVPPHGVLIAGLPKTPGARDLPGADRETMLLHRRFPQAHVLMDEEVTRSRVFGELPAHPVVHFACHAATVPASPSRSHLLLYDGPATTLDIAGQHLTNAQIAFLSACATTDTAPELTDEAVHVTAAFQLAGHTHVIGTLWPIIDAVAPDLADLFYKEVTTRTQTLDASQCAFALHTAVSEIYRRHPTAPITWASHIHVGP